MEIDIWSSNKIERFEFCPVKFSLKEKYSPPLSLDARGFYHIKIHDILKIFWDPEKNFKSAETFSKFWKGYWRNAVEREGGYEKFKNPEDAKIMVGAYYHKGSHILYKFYRDNIWKKLKSVAEGFRRIPTDFQGFPLEGRFDEIFHVSDEEAHLTDYNMTKRPPNYVKKMLKKDPKVVLMSIAFDQEYEGTKSKAGKNLLRHDETVLDKITHEDHMNLIERLSRIKSLVEDEKIEPSTGEHCKECEFFDLHYALFRGDRKALSKQRKPDFQLIGQQASS